MFENFRPKETFSKVENINLDVLVNDLNIKGLIFDFDGTLRRNRTISKDCIRFIKKAQDSGLKVSIVSNNFYLSKDILRKLRIRAVSRFALKPLLSPFKRMAQTMKLSPERIAFIGNTYITDIYGANRAGMYSIYIQDYKGFLFRSKTSKELGQRGIKHVK